MSPATLYFFVAAAISSALAQKAPVNANPTDTNNPVLVGKRFPFNQIPFQSDTTDSPRGTQFGYNICNSTTAGPTSLCQTSFINSIDDFCLWGSPNPNTAIGDSESFEVAWCTKDHGARRIPAGALTAVQFIKTPSYVQVTGFINQVLVGLPDGDFGGELDSGGQDQRGNPIGGLVYSTNLPGATGSGPQQAVPWTLFIGSNQFCYKACSPDAANGVGLCQHIYDRIGCAYNAPAAYTPGVFESCLGDDMDPVGVYTSNGVVTTYHQPAESLGPITTVPYTPRIPASSQCTTFSSAQLYAGAPSVSIPPTTTTTSTTSSSTGTATGSVPTGTVSKTSSSTGSAAPTGTSGSNAALSSRDLNILLPGAAAFLGYAFLA